MRTLQEFIAPMGSKPEARFRFIQDRAAFAKDLDI
jgi:topoisomerase-4 subunit B